VRGRFKGADVRLADGRVLRDVSTEASAAAAASAKAAKAAAATPTSPLAPTTPADKTVAAAPSSPTRDASAAAIGRGAVRVRMRVCLMARLTWA
jgi:hypothetical protein